MGRRGEDTRDKRRGREEEEGREKGKEKEEKTQEIGIDERRGVERKEEKN